MQKLCTGPDNCGRPSIKRALPKSVRGTPAARPVGKKQMRPGPATRAASYVDFRACFSRYAGEMLKVRQRSAAGVPLLPELVADHDFHHRSASTAGTRGLILFKDRMRRRPQCPRTTSTRSRPVWRCPRRFTLENRRLATGSTASSASSRSSHVFTADTLRQAGVVRNRKTSSACAEAVNYADYLWKATEKIG